MGNPNINPTEKVNLTPYLIKGALRYSLFMFINNELWIYDELSCNPEIFPCFLVFKKTTWGTKKTKKHVASKLEKVYITNLRRIG